MKRDYTTADGKLTVHWDSTLCTHCGNCVGGLPEVFDLANRPWVSVDAASPANVERQVSECPSGALSFTKHEQGS